MVESVESFEDVYTDELVIAVDHHQYFSLTAKRPDGFVYIGHVSFPLQVFHHQILFFLTSVPPFKFLLDLLASSICRSIVDKNHSKIRIILTDDGMHVEVVFVIFHVHVGGNNDAEGQLFVLVYFVFFIIVLVLLLEEIV